jgi:hypothetical protein
VLTADFRFGEQQMPEGAGGHILSQGDEKSFEVGREYENPPRVSS